MDGQDMIEQGRAWATGAWQVVQGWLTSPAFWTQAALLLASWLLAVWVSRRLKPQIARILTPAEEAVNLVARGRRFLLLFLPLLLPLLAWAFTAVGEQVTRSLFGTGAIIAFGKRLFLLAAAIILVREVISDGFLRFLGRYVLIPIAALNAAGLLDDVTGLLETSVVSLGNISFSAMSLVRGVIAGSLLFWLGMWSNAQSANYIGRQPMRPAIRQLSLKAAEVVIFGIAFLLLMNIMGISLTSLTVIGGAIGIGVGFGLQQIAANFAAGVILLVEGQATVGDFVELDGGEAGRIIKLGARATILETFDGRWIVVPNEHFVTTRVVNWSDAGSAHRYEVGFSLSYDTDINQVPEVIEAAVAALPFVLATPKPGCDLKAFGESSVDFEVDFWVQGLDDDGDNSFRSDVLFAVWNACKAHGFDMPYPHRVVELRSAT